MSPQTSTMIPSSSLTPSSSIGFNTMHLKMVKGANVFRQGEIYFIKHYETIIFAYNDKSKLAEINWHCSQTSDRQIRNALIFFDVSEENQVDVSDGSKWSYSETRQY